MDPKAEGLYGVTPYNSMLNNPIYYTDQEGDWVHIAVGAALGGVFNLGYQAFSGNINSGQDALVAFGIGALAGGVSAATGGAAAGAFGAASSYGAAIGTGAVVGAVGGASAGLIEGTGNAMYFQNQNFGDAFTGAGLQGAMWGGITGGILGGIGGGVGHWWNNRGSVPNGSMNSGKSTGPTGSLGDQIIPEFQTGVKGGTGHGEGLLDPFLKSASFGVDDFADPSSLIRTETGRTWKISTNNVASIMNTAKTIGITKPVDVFRYGGKSYIINGHHRTHAAMRLGQKVPVNYMSTPGAYPNVWSLQIAAERASSSSFKVDGRLLRLLLK